MGAKRVEIGATGDTVRENIARVRRERGLTLRSLSDTMAELGRPMSNSSLSQIENGSRRVDVDDLMSISIALEVSPNTLLMPDSHNSESVVELTGSEQLSARRAWHFLDGMRSVRSNELEFALRSAPSFLRPPSRHMRAGTVDDQPMRVSRQMQTDGTNVDMSVGIGWSDIFAEEDD